jgi:hypothetical protein
MTIFYDCARHNLRPSKMKIIMGDGYQYFKKKKTLKKSS